MRLKKTYRALVTGLFACCVFLAAAPAFAEMTPTETLKEGIDKIITILKDPKVNTEGGKNDVIRILSEMADDYFAFEELTKRSVGRPWLTMTAEQKEQFTKAYRRLLELTYLQRIRQYDNEKVEFTKERIKGNKAMVLTNIMAKDSVFSVNYRLIKLDGRWLVYDIIGENISLVKNYRQQFNEILQKGTVAELIERIEERVATLEAAKAEGE